MDGELDAVRDICFANDFKPFGATLKVSRYGRYSMHLHYGLYRSSDDESECHSVLARLLLD